MSYQISNFTDNDDIKTLDQQGPFSIIEYQRDLSVTPASALNAYYCSQMNVRKRQVVCDLSKADITTQAGAMQWMLGDVNATTGIKGVGHLLGKAVRGKVTGESAINPEYTGSGILVLGDVPDPENYSTYFMKIDGVKFKRKVVPGDTLQFEIHLLEPIRRGVAVVEAKAFVGETLACEAVLMAQVVKNKKQEK